jgi:hypothetical protein
MLAETTDRCSRLQWQSEMAEKRLSLNRHSSVERNNSLDREGLSRPLSPRLVATSPRVRPGPGVVVPRCKSCERND